MKLKKKSTDSEYNSIDLESCEDVQLLIQALRFFRDHQVNAYVAACEAMGVLENTASLMATEHPRDCMVARARAYSTDAKSATRLIDKIIKGAKDD